MSVLIDNVYWEYGGSKSPYIHEGRGYLKKPKNKERLTTRIRDALGVLSGKCVAVYFMEDIVDES